MPDIEACSDFKSNEMKTRLKLINKTVLILLALTMILVLSTCDVADDLLGNTAVAKLSGEWNCEEESEYFKSTAASSYRVYISPDPDNESGVLIDGFYNLGDVGAKANVSGSSITLLSQTLEGGFVVLTGSGSISSNYQEITWSYNINIGGDAVDHVTAVYTKVE